MPVINRSSVSAPSGNISFQLQPTIYTWNSGYGYEIKQDIISLPLLAVLVKISSDFPVRFRLYQTVAAQQADLSRPPYASNQNKGIFLDALLGGASTSNQLILSPVCLIAGVTQYPITLEKLLPDATTINLLIELVK